MNEKQHRNYGLLFYKADYFADALLAYTLLPNMFSHVVVVLSRYHHSLNSGKEV